MARKMVIFQLTNRSFEELFNEEASVDKCIKYSKKFSNIFWKNWSAESLPVEVLKVQPVFSFKKGLLSKIIFKMAVYLKHFTNFCKTIRGTVFLLAKFFKKIYSYGRFLETFFKFFRAVFLTLSGDCFG